MSLLGGNSVEKQKTPDQLREDQIFAEKTANATPEKTEEMKKGVGSALGYGAFVPPEQGQEGEQKENEQQSEKGNEQTKTDEKFKDSPDYVVLQRLEQYVPKEQYNEALEKFQKETDKQNAKQIVIDLSKSISDPKVQEEYTKLLEGKKKK